MRVALIHDWLNGMRGAEKVLEAFCEIFPEAIIFTLFYEKDKVTKTISSHEVRASILNKIPGFRQSYRNMLPLFPAAIERFNLSNFDLVISSSHCVAKGAKPAPDALHICFCHSPMRYVWDRFDDYFSDVESRQIKRYMARAICMNLRRWDVQSSSRVDLFISNSEFVQRRIKKFYNRPSTVIYPFADVDFYTPDNAAKKNAGNYFLAVSALVPYKRIQDIVEAFGGLDERLIVVGDGPEKHKLMKMASSNVEFTGWLSSQKILGLYRDCRALIFPGVEDFGIVPIEAQACGRPVIALAEGGALETVKGPIIGIDRGLSPNTTGLFFKKPGAMNIVEAIKRFKTIQFDGHAIRNNALKFSRESFIGEIREFVNESYSLFRSYGRKGLEEKMMDRSRNLKESLK
jgi:glycosyltransferase involved in cell wall biosynthesis